MRATLNPHITAVRYALLILALISLFAASACGGGEDEAEATGPSAPTTTQPSAEQPTSPPEATAAPLPAQQQPVERAIDGMVMVHVPAGEFLMGSDESAFPPERPAHLVTLDEYWIDRTEVTNAQYRLCVEAGVCAEPKPWEDANLNTDDQPALVLWEAARTYCEWAGGRLPTEAEWEKAARGTDGRLWPWGQEFEPGRANLSGDEDGYGYTAPVGSFPDGASPYGLQDMAGNAAEWVADWYDPEYYTHSPAQNPPGPAGGEQKLVRGTISNAGGGPEKCRCVARYPQDPVRWEFGFRCVTADYDINAAITIEPPSGAIELPGPSGGPAVTPTPSMEQAQATPVEQAGAPLEVSDLEEVNSYRLTMTSSAGAADTDMSSVVITEEWVREPGARRLTVSYGTGAPEVEYIIIGSSAWVRVGQEWITIPESEVESYEDNLSAFLRPEPDMVFAGEETVNGIRCKHYVRDIDLSTQTLHHEIWVADQADLPSVVVRVVYRSEVKSGEMSMLTLGEIDVTDINAPITIEPPQ
jgi:formylglycine-generating enzyme required for sulfatase activity